jgi:hypothetical protein
LVTCPLGGGVAVVKLLIFIVSMWSKICKEPQVACD